MCYTGLVMEYMELLGQVDRPDVPLHQKRGMMDVLSRITQYMNNDQLNKYKELAAKLTPQLPFLGK